MRTLNPQDPAVTHAAVLDALPIVAYMADPHGAVTYLSREWQRFTGYDASEVLEQGYGVVIHPGDLSRAAAKWDAARAAGGSYRDDFRLRFGDGSYRWVLSQADPMHGHGGTIVGWFGTLTDIHALRLAEEEVVRALEVSARSAGEARARAEFVERLMDASDDCVKVLDLAARLVSMSPNGQKALGIMDFSSVEGADWVDFWQGDDRVAARTAVAAALAGRRGRFTGLYAVEGREKWWDVTVTPILDDDGRPERLLAVSRDVTESRRVDRDLARSEERYRLLGEALPGTTWTAKPDGRLDYISGQAANDHMLSSGRLDDLWLDSVHPDDRARVLARWLESVETGEPYDTQFRVQRASGAYRWQLVRALPQRDDAGAIVRWVGVNVDVDDQRRADEAREQLVRLVEASDDFIGIGDEHGNATYVNGAGRRLLGLGTLEQTRATHLIDYFMPEDRAFVASEILPAVARDGRWVGDYRFRHTQSGEQIPVWYNAFKLTNDRGESVGIATVSRDLRERRRFEVGMRALAETGAAMYASLDFEGTVRNVADAVAQSFASFCIVDVLDGGAISYSIAGAHARPGAARSAPVCGRKPDRAVAEAIEHGRSTLLQTLPEDWTKSAMNETFVEFDGLDARSLIVVPIRSGAESLVSGVLTCIIDGFDPRGTYSAEDLRFAQEIAVRAGLAMYHARAYEHQRRIAVTLQEASLPRILPALDDLSLSADYRPGNSEATIGGDWYDAFVLDDGRLAITVGDVLGSGLGAAVTMGKVRQAMRSAAMLVPDPNAMLDVADHTVRAESDDLYATALAGIYDPSRHEFAFASAGHPGPLLLGPDARIEEFSSPGMLLGLRSRGETEMMTCAVPPGSTLVFYTDGLVEATRDSDEGLRRVQAALMHGRVSGQTSAHALVEHVLHGEPATDDIAVLVAEFAGDSHGVTSRYHAAPGSEAVVMTLPAQSEQVAAARHAARMLLSAASASEDVVALVELAAGELVGNALRHGSGPTLDFAVRILPGRASVAVTNEGACFERRSIELTTMKLEECGRGLALLAAYGCTLTVAATPKNRCTVTAAFPL